MPSEHRLHPTSILFALAGSSKALLLPAVLLLLTGRSSPDPDGWNPAGWVNRAVPGDFEIANWTLEPPVSTPISRSTAIDADRIR